MATIRPQFTTRISKEPSPAVTVHATFANGAKAFAERDDGPMSQLFGLKNYYAIASGPDGALLACAFNGDPTLDSLEASLNSGEGFSDAVRHFGLFEHGSPYSKAGEAFAKSLRPQAVVARAFGAHDNIDADRYAAVWRHAERDNLIVHVQEWPFLRRLLGQHSSLDDAIATGSPQRIALALKETLGVEVPQPLMRRLRGVELPTDHLALLLAKLAKISSANLPSTAGEWRSARVVADAAATIEAHARQAGLAAETPLIRTGVTWEGAETRVRKLMSYQDDALPNSRLNDVAKAFVEDVLRPAYRHLGGICDFATERALEARAYEILLDGRSVCDVYEADAFWHRARHEIERGMPKAPQLADVKWPSICDDFVAPNGVTLTCLTGSADLLAEGRSGDGGLDHCVGGRSYMRDCLNGVSAILSARLADGDGSFRRLSTIEVSIRNGVLERQQHHGLSNAHPPLEAQQAYGALERAVREGQVRLTPFSPPDPMPSLDYDWSSIDNVETAYRLWSKSLPKPYRGMELGDIIGDILALPQNAAP